MRGVFRIRCGICWDEDEEPGILQCGHVFGKSCLERHVQGNGNCPTCRLDVDVDDILPVYLSSFTEAVESDNISSGPSSPHSEKGITPSEFEKHVAALQNAAHAAKGFDLHYHTLQQVMGVLQPAEAAITRLSLVTPDGPLADVLEELSNHLIAIRKHTKYGQLLEEAKRETQKIFPVIRDREQQLQAMAVDKATLEEQLKQAQADQIRLADVNREIAASVESWRQKAIKTRDTAKSSITKSRKRLVEAEKREKLLQNELEMLKKKRAITVRTRKRQESSKRGLPGAFSPEHVSDDSEEDHDMLFDESGSAREVEGVLAPIPSPIQPAPIASTSSAHLHIHHNAASTTPRSPYHRMFPWQETPQQWQPRFRDSPPPPPQPVHQPTPPQPRRRTFWSYIGL